MLAGPRRRPRIGWALLLGLAMVLLLPGGASAQDGTTSSSAPAEGAAIFGTLSDPAGKAVEGAKVTVSTSEEEVGTATSDASGEWRIPVPAAGRYVVELDVSSLPAGVKVADGAQAKLGEVRVLEGRDKRVLFSLTTGSGAASSAPRSNERSTTDKALNLAFSGVVVGFVVALASIGLSLVFGATGLVNFAHGEMVTFGALVAWFFNAGSGGPAWTLVLAGAVAMVASGAFGALQDRGLWRPLERRRLDLISRMIVSIGAAMFLRYTYAVLFNASPRPYREYAAQAPWTWGPLVFPPKQLAVVALSLAVIVVYATTLQRTRIGTAIRAVSDNRDLAESSGIDVDRIVLLVWVAGSALAGLGGVAYSTLYGVQWDMGFRLLLPIFAAVVLGGLGTAYGALVGGLVIGLVSEMSTLWFPAEFKFAWGLAALIVVLVVRPQGILGRAERIG